MAKRLFIDLELFRRLADIRAGCNYFYHPGNDGVKALREMATYALICRHCELANCVEACHRVALEKAPDNVLKRYNLRCVSCKSCSIACPFGTILPELVPYYTSGCDHCIGRIPEEDMPFCVKTCTNKDALKYEEIIENPAQGVYYIGEHLAVRAMNFKELVENELMKELK